MLGKLEKFLVVALSSMLFFQDHNYLYVYGLEINLSGFACKLDFKDKETKLKAITDCATKVNYKLPPDFSIESIEGEFKALIASGFDDKCFAKCWYESENLIAKDGKVASENFANFYKSSNISEPLLKEYTKLFDECVKETEPKFKDSKEIPCKMYTMIDVCCFKKYEEHKTHLEEICNKGSR